MITRDEYKTIRQERHLIVLDTNILLELYRQPANVSRDIIAGFQKIADKVYIPHRVYEEYLENRQKICGDEQKKYKIMKHELDDSTSRFKESIRKKTNEYRKHNYSGITKLQGDIERKLDEIKETIVAYEDVHKEQFQSDLDFLKNDEVYQFVQSLKERSRVGSEIPFSEKLKIIQEGELRYRNEIPPGYKDIEKTGMEKYGDLFIWKEIIRTAYKERSHILFISNDTKEDWWKSEKNEPDDLREELQEEFLETNPFWQIHFLTLSKFFGYLSDELEIGESLSALQLTAQEDAADLLKKLDEKIRKQICEQLATKVDQTVSTPENIYLQTISAFVEKEEKMNVYHVQMVCVFLKEKRGIHFLLEAEIEKEEYDTECELRKIEIHNVTTTAFSDEAWEGMIKAKNKHLAWRKYAQSIRHEIDCPIEYSKDDKNVYEILIEALRNDFKIERFNANHRAEQYRRLYDYLTHFYDEDNNESSSENEEE